MLIVVHLPQSTDKIQSNINIKLELTSSDWFSASGSICYCQDCLLGTKYFENLGSNMQVYHTSITLLKFTLITIWSLCLIVCIFIVHCPISLCKKSECINSMLRLIQCTTEIMSLLDPVFVSTIWHRSLLIWDTSFAIFCKEWFRGKIPTYLELCNSSSISWLFDTIFCD